MRIVPRLCVRQERYSSDLSPMHIMAAKGCLTDNALRLLGYDIVMVLICESGYIERSCIRQDRGALYILDISYLDII